jgi:hypothetical protein
MKYKHIYILLASAYLLFTENVMAQRYTVSLPKLDGTVNVTKAGLDSTQLRLSADQNKTPTDQLLLKFDPNILPSNYKLISMDLRLYTKAMADTNSYQQAYIYKTNGANWLPNMATFTNPEIDATKIGTEEISRTGLTSFNIKNYTPNQAFTLAVRSPSKSQNNLFYSSYELKRQRSYSNLPKLILGYEITNEIVARDWNQYKNGAQHAGVLNYKTIGNATELRLSIQLNNPLDEYIGGSNNKAILLYKEGAIVFQETKNYTSSSNQYKMRYYNRNGKPIWSRPLSTIPKFLPLIDRSGYIYIFSQDKLQILDLEKGAEYVSVYSNSLANLLEDDQVNIENEITMGYDGSLYITTNKGITALTPYPELKVKWKYILQSYDIKIGAISLSLDEKTAFAIEVNKQAGKFIAIDNVDGSLLSTAAQPLKRYTTDQVNTLIPAPVVADAQSVFVLNGYATSSELFLFKFNNQTKKIILDKTITAKTLSHKEKNTGISQPAVDGEGHVFFVYDGKMTGLDLNAGNEIRFSGPEGLDNSSVLVTNNSSQIYAIDIYGMMPSISYYKYVNDKLLYQTKIQGLARNPFQQNLVLSPSGYLYTLNSSNLFTITPTMFDQNEINLTSINSNCIYNANNKITIEPLRVSAATNAILRAGKSIKFKKRFSIQKGAQLIFRTANN